jgi:asparagine synthase (glutamine-hydrolysing)
MCGIAGWLEPGGQRPEAQLQTLGDALAHRGPDDRGTLWLPQHGLGFVHNRLSIIDLSPAGHEPMVAPDGVALSFNGEIYNFEELRRELQGAGYAFTSRTDAEVVLHGYRHWGAAVVERLAGMFAFAIWDAPRRVLFLARDPLGIKPLYVWRSASGIVFASELKAFLQLPDFRPRPCALALRQFLEFNFVLDRRAASLDGVSKLPPGSTLTFSASALDPTPEVFFEPGAVTPSCGSPPADLDARADQLFEILDAVVAQHLVADVPLALLLSGGLDSSLLAALAVRRGPLRTLSMAFADSRVDERPFARVVSRHLGTQHEEILLDSADVARDLPAAVRHVDDLHGDWGVVSTRLLYQRCRDAGVRVVLVGEGSDELFGGYPQFADAVNGAPRSAWRRALRLYHTHAGRRYGRGLPGFFGLMADIDRETGGDPFSAVRLFELRHQLPHCYNMKVDKASMAASVEARVPYLDVRVARAALAMPGELLVRDGTNKAVLRRMAERQQLLPAEITQRAKFGGSMAASWLDERPEFREFARQVILDEGGWAGPLGLRPAMEDYFNRGRQGYAFPRALSILSILAWRLLMLDLWSRHYLPGVRPGL